MFSGRHNLKKIDGKVFIDRDPETFKMLINYLRNNLVVPPPLKHQNDRIQLNQELEFWGLNQYRIPSENENLLISKFEKFPN